MSRDRVEEQLGPAYLADHMSVRRRTSFTARPPERIFW